jgi:hypothetical protein
MQTVDPSTTRPATRRRKRLIVLAACLFAAFLVGLGTKLWIDRRAPSPNADAARLSRYMASPQFAALPDAQKAPYLEAIGRANERGELTPDQQRDVFRNAMKHHGKSPIQKYFDLPPGKERQKFLDKVIDEQSKMPLTPPPGPPHAKGIQIKGQGVLDSIPPEDRAQMDQFMQDLHDRRQALGLPDDGGRVMFREH